MDVPINQSICTACMYVCADYSEATIHDDKKDHWVYATSLLHQCWCHSKAGGPKGPIEWLPAIPFPQTSYKDREPTDSCFALIGAHQPSICSGTTNISGELSFRLTTCTLDETGHAVLLIICLPCVYFVCRMF